MKKVIFPFLLIGSMLSMMSFTTKPDNKTTQKNEPTEQSLFKAVNYPKAEENPTVIVDEDFSGLTAGSENAPDTESLLDENGYVANPDLFKPYDNSCTATWGGYGLYQAGGCLAAVNGGFINTPTGDYSGKLKMTFRIKLQAGQDVPSASIDVILMRRSQLIDFKRETFTLTEEWQTFTFEADNGWWSDCMIQFFTMGSITFLVDDIKITHVITGIEPPQIAQPLTQGDDSFMAKWEPTSTADEYLLSVYHKTENPNVVSEQQDFESIQSTEDGTKIDLNNPGYPQGWTICLAENGQTRHLYNEEGYAKDGEQSLCFDETGDYIETPNVKYPIKEFQFWTKVDDRNLGGSPVSGNTQLIISVLTEGGWIPWLYTPVKNIIQAGGQVIANLTPELDYMENIYQVRIEFSKPEDEKCMLAIDQVTYKAPGLPINAYYWEDKPISGKDTDSAIVTGLDPDLDYFYSVKARNSQYTSAPSAEMEVFDVSDPVALEATQIEANSYTANWTSGNKVDYFTVSQQLSFTAKEDMPEYVVLEEDFSKVVSEGTAENPEIGAYNNSYVPIDQYTKIPGWMATSYSLGNGMLGGMETDFSMDALSGAISTPAMNLSSNNEGKFQLNIRLYAQAGDFINIQGTDYTVTNAYIEFIETGWQEVTCEMFTYFQDEVLTIFSNQYQSFMIDHIKITQPLKAGETVTLTTGKTIVDDKTQRSAEITHAYFQDGCTTSYNVKAFRYYHGNTDDVWESPQSNSINVTLPSSSVETPDSNLNITVEQNAVVVSLEQAAPIRIYTMDGRMIQSVDGLCGANRIPLEEGFYIVHTSDLTSKVIIR